MLTINEPLVTIGMPVYNGERFLPVALDSLIRQGYKNFELIISDNASTDATYKICQHYAGNDKRIRHIRNESNIGALENFNQVLRISNSDYFMWAACDDVWEPGYLKELVNHILTSTGAVLAFCLFDHVDEKGVGVRSYPKIKTLFGISNRVVRANRFLWFPEHEGSANLIYGLMKTSTVRNMGGLMVYGHGDYGIDNLFIFRLALSGKFVYTDRLLFHKRQVPESGTFAAWKFFDWLEYRGLYRKIILQSAIPSGEKVLLAIAATVRQFVDLLVVLVTSTYSAFWKHLKRLTGSLKQS